MKGERWEGRQNDCTKIKREREREKERERWRGRNGAEEGMKIKAKGGMH